MFVRSLLVPLVSALSLVAAGCIMEQPGVELAIPSPDKRFVVELHNEPTIDPPQQSLWIARSGGDSQRVKTVSSDGPRWRGPSAWSDNSRHFAFAVADRDVYVVDAESGTIVLEGEGPGGGSTHEIRSLSFDAADSLLTIEVCERQSRVCSGLHERLDGRAGESAGLRKKMPRAR